MFHGETLDSIANGISCRLKGLYLIRPLEGREARRFGFFLGPAGRSGWSRHGNQEVSGLLDKQFRRAVNAGRARPRWVRVQFAMSCSHKIRRFYLTA
jgi:hypothetical protein